MSKYKIIFFDYYGVVDTLWAELQDQRDVLSELSKRFRLGIISNSTQATRDALSGAGFDFSFEPIVLSGECGLAKPSKEIFEYACSQARVKPSEALFVDDQVLHLEGAQAADFGACLYFGSSRQLENKFESVPDFRALKGWLDE